MLAWSFIFSNSAGVSFPGLFRMCSGIANFPMSWRRADASIARNHQVVSNAQRFSESNGVVLDPPNVAVCNLVLRIDCKRKSFNR